MKQIRKVTEFYVLPCELSDDADRISDIANKCGKITAIWVMRRMYNIGLKEAKDFIDSLVND